MVAAECACRHLNSKSMYLVIVYCNPVEKIQCDLYSIDVPNTAEKKYSISHWLTLFRPVEKTCDYGKIFLATSSSVFVGTELTWDKVNTLCTNRNASLVWAPASIPADYKTTEHWTCTAKFLRSISDHYQRSLNIFTSRCDEATSECRQFHIILNTKADDALSEPVGKAVTTKSYFALCQIGKTWRVPCLDSMTMYCTVQFLHKKLF